MGICFLPLPGEKSKRDAMRGTPGVRRSRPIPAAFFAATDVRNVATPLSWRNGARPGRRSAGRFWRGGQALQLVKRAAGRVQIAKTDLGLGQLGQRCPSFGRGVQRLDQVQARLTKVFEL